MTPPIVFIHGMWSRPAVFDGIRRRLEAAGYTTHAPTLPFHDRDPALAPPPALGTMAIDDYLADLAAEIARIPGPVIVAGHSLGGFLAQAVAARVEAAGLMLFAPGAVAGINAFSADAVRTLGGVMLRQGWWRRPALLGPGPARWGIYNEVPTAIADAEIAALVWDSGRVLFQLAFPFLDRSGAAAVDLARLTMPALIVVGDRDRATPAAIARATARKLAGTVDYHELSGVGHWLWWGDVEDRVAAITGGWLVANFPPTKWDAST